MVARPRHTVRTQWILSLISGLMLAAAFPKISQGWLAWIGLVPLLLALRKSSGRSGFALACGTGTIAHLVMMYWTVHAMHEYGYVPIPQSISVLVLLAAVMGGFTGLFGWIVSWCRRPLHALVVAPVAWVAVEFLRTWLFTGFPWELLGYSQYQYVWMIQVADLFGVYGLSGLIVLVNMVLALAILSWVEQPWQTEAVATSLTFRSGALASLMIVAVAVYGLISIRATDQRMQNAPKAHLSVIQGNIDQSIKWDSAFQVQTTAKYKNLSLAVAEKKVDLIIWPETATPFYLNQDALLTQMVMEGVKQANADFVIGSPSVDESRTDGQFFFNSAYLISSDGRVTGKYDKVHLVPFGEYVPLKRFLWFVDKLVAQVGDFKTGRKGHVLEHPKYRLGLQICYEIIFAELSRAMVQNGANLLVNITNDAWFGRTSAAYQHFSMAVFRAVENRRFLARAANTGISGFIDPCGRVLGTTALFEEATLTAEAALLEHRTFYSRWGDAPLTIFCFGLLSAAALRRWAGRRTYAGRGNAISG